jgi:hemerythrin-like domain-containing protein
MTSHTVSPDAPADTQMMGIVHSALRRDLVRVGLVLGTPAAAEPARRTAIAEHVLWLMRFLHDHHSGEDDGLYPLVVRRNPDSADLVEQMDADHSSITPAMEALESVAKQHLTDPTAPDSALTAAVDRLCEVLFPHLEREERDMMPVVSASITQGEWQAWDQEHNLKPKGMMTLAVEGHWLIDGLDERSSDHVKHLVPPVPRFVLVRLLGGPYRRKRAALWSGTPALDVPSLSADQADTWAA